MEDKNKKIKEALAEKILYKLNDISIILDRFNLKIAHSEYAKEAGVSESAYYLALKGEASVDTALKVCRILNIELL